MKSLAAWIASRPRPERDAFLDGLSRNALASLPYLFPFWARADHQLPPRGDWTTWVILGGRGSGKTRAGAEWIRAQVEGATPLARGGARAVALLGQTWEQAREVMVFGDSGLMACSPADRRPVYHATRRALVWPNGAEARLFSAADPESLRGPQFDRAWSDELGKWRRAGDAWDMLQFGLRLGDRPRQVVTTTPRDISALRAILDDPDTLVTTAPTDANRANLAPAFIETITRRYRGTAQGRQELDGELLTEAPGAMFPRAAIEAARVRAAPALDDVVVGVDPPVTSGPAADACGIVAVGRAGEAFYVLADDSLRGASPPRWGARVVESLVNRGATRVVVETNQGGDLIAGVLRQIDPSIAVRAVRATRSKAARAEPVSMLYARGLVRHVGVFPALEDELADFARGGRSPDRVDALVWAIAELSGANRAAPRVRSL